MGNIVLWIFFFNFRFSPVVYYEDPSTSSWDLLACRREGGTGIILHQTISGKGKIGKPSIFPESILIYFQSTTHMNFTEISKFSNS